MSPSGTIPAILRVAISSRALFDLEAEDRIYHEQGLEAYLAYQQAHQSDLPGFGTGYPLVRKLLTMDTRNQNLVEVMVISKNNAFAGLRISKALAATGLPIGLRVFTAGRSTHPYLVAMGAHLYLTASPEDAEAAAQQGIPSALVVPSRIPDDLDDQELRIAFDGDCCLFGDESERYFQTVMRTHGREAAINAFQQREAESAHTPLSRGPMAAFLEALGNLQAIGCSLRTALVTARQAPADERVVRTLQSWNLAVDEFMFLGGREKAPFLEAFRADFFVDDQPRHLVPASKVVPSARIILPFKSVVDHIQAS